MTDVAPNWLSEYLREFSDEIAEGLAKTDEELLSYMVEDK